jgi:hypothetical protein
MKTNILTTIISLFLLGALILACSSCGDDNKKGADTPQDESVNPKPNQPINLTVFIDLSDRIIKTRDGLRQAEKDTALLNTIAQYVADKAQSKNIRYAKDRMKIVFYPAPLDSAINKRAQALEVDFGRYTKKDLVAKLQRANDLARDFNKDLQVIYNDAINQHNFTGSDIWGFFNSKVNDYCVKDGYRNVLVILTDGYIYDLNHKVEENGKANFITKRTLADGINLMPTGQEVDNLEVLVLEVNANPVSDFAKIKSTISEWFDSMGIKTFKITETDLPSNTEGVIKEFLK